MRWLSSDAVAPSSAALVVALTANRSCRLVAFQFECAMLDEVLLAICGMDLMWLVRQLPRLHVSLLVSLLVLQWGQATRPVLIHDTLPTHMCQAHRHVVVPRPYALLCEQHQIFRHLVVCLHVCSFPTE